MGVMKTAKDLGILEPMLYSWRSMQKHGASSFEHQKMQQAELAILRRDVARHAEENAFLKKAAAYFAKQKE